MQENTHLTSLSQLNSDNTVDDNFTVELKKQKTRKAGGLDGLQPEHLKHGGTLLTPWLKQIFILLVHIPPHILTGIICPVYKGKGKTPLTVTASEALLEHLLSSNLF